MCTKTAEIDVRKITFCAALLVFLGVPACFNASSHPKVDGGAGGKGGSAVSGSGGKGSGGAPNDASTVDAPNDASTIDVPNDASTIDVPMEMRGPDPTTCTLDAECSTGNCVDGVCCDTSCDGQCESCKEAGSAGTCTAIKGVPLVPRAACGGTGPCAGKCDGTNGKTCTFPDNTTVCTAATCVSGKVTTASVCNEIGSCSTSMASTCPNSLCATGGAAKCETSCTATSCGAGSYCDTTGVCLVGQANGSSCSAGAMCASGYCVDGLCCDGKCDGQCESCKEAASMGKCIALKGAPLATHTACGGTGVCKGQCDGVNRTACAFPDGSAICTAASCAAGKATTASVCNGSGACTTAATSSCTSNLCATDGTGKCSGSCTATSCAAGTYCDSTGTCTKTLDNGAACSAGTQCTSANCVDGVCCDGKCDGQCQSCKETGSVGKCKTVKGDPISPRAACGGTAKCKAQCGGTSATACTYPDSSVECTAAKCTAGKVTTASVCNSSGSCTAAGTNACDSNLCAADGITCAGSCTATSCAAGTYCATGGACAPTIADGKPCSANNQCAHNTCVSGVCCATACGTCHSCTTGTCTLVAKATACTTGSTAGVCDSAGTCNACTSGAACTTGINTACQTGAINCSSGAAVCVASNKSNTTTCGAGPSCTGGKSTAQSTCLNGACMTPAPMTCQSGACSGTGTTCLACSLPAAPTGITPSTSSQLCPSTQVTLTVAGGTPGTGGAWVWYPNSTHTGSVGTGPSIVVKPTSTTTYYVRAEGPCGTSSPDVSTTVSILPPPRFATNPSTYALSCPIDNFAWIDFTANPSSDTMVKSVQWSADYPDSNTNTVDWAHTRYFTGGATTTLSVAPAFSTYVWCTITDTCDRTVSSTHALLTVPTCE